jgi:hypothetical protein
MNSEKDKEKEYWLSEFKERLEKMNSKRKERNKKIKSIRKE